MINPDTANETPRFPPLSIDLVAASIRNVKSLAAKRKDSLVDEIAKSQPNLLAHVLALAKLDVPIEKVDIVLNILLVLHDLFTRATPEGLANVSEEMIESLDRNQWALLKMMDSEEPDEARRLCQLAVKSHPEINALAYANGALHDCGIYDMRKQEDFYCVRAVRNLVDAFSKTRRAVIVKEKP